MLELLLVIVITGTIIAIAMPTASNQVEKARIKKAILDIRTIDRMLKDFEFTRRRLPDTLDELGDGVPTDPWGNEYQYLRILGGGAGIAGVWRKDQFLVPVNQDFDLFSMGKDGEWAPPLGNPQSVDDVIRAIEGSFLGLASEF